MGVDIFNKHSRSVYGAQFDANHQGAVGKEIGYHSKLLATY
jgi:hypothetical protein